MKQQILENMLKDLIQASHMKNTHWMNCIAVDAAILFQGGLRARSVEKAYTNNDHGFAKRDPENMDPYGPQNHPLNTKTAKVLGFDEDEYNPHGKE